MCYHFKNCIHLITVHTTHSAHRKTTNMSFNTRVIAVMYVFFITKIVFSIIVYACMYVYVCINKMFSFLP